MRALTLVIWPGWWPESLVPVQGLPLPEAVGALMVLHPAVLPLPVLSLGDPEAMLEPGAHPTTARLSTLGWQIRHDH